MRHDTPTALETTATDLSAALMQLGKPATSYSDLRWSLYLRMLNNRWRIVAAAQGTDTAYWDATLYEPEYTDDWRSAFSDLEETLEARLESGLTRTERMEVEAALMALDAIRADRNMAEG